MTSVYILPFNSWMPYTLFQNGARAHRNEAIGARYCEITIDLHYAEGVFFSKFSFFFFNKRLFDSKANNSEPLENMLIDICMSFDVLLGFYRKMYVVRSDDNKMAISTVSSYEEIDYNRSLAAFLDRISFPISSATLS